ncbi:hypothetical protein K490DRAFT_55521 [Saccharata proteae CBS 121410]|uniref:SET domain-containing protein n=1 Tax=Saccharata proteae CBS 121410 TaxID=1314787 RepID=A0A6A5YB02_9PEZI|nr:hypothetical protein K490DRAFT_55521 [Saccharata proteae CBS 121410]
MNTPPRKFLNDAELAAAVEKIVREVDDEYDASHSEAFDGIAPVNHSNYVDEHTGGQFEPSVDESLGDSSLPQLRQNSNEQIVNMAGLGNRMRMSGDSGDENEPEIVSNFRTMSIASQTTSSSAVPTAPTATTPILSDTEFSEFSQSVPIFEDPGTDSGEDTIIVDPNSAPPVQPRAQESPEAKNLAVEAASAETLPPGDAQDADDEEAKKPKKKKKARGGKKAAEKKLQAFMAQMEPGEEGKYPCHWWNRRASHLLTSVAGGERRKPFELRESLSKGEGLFALMNLPVGAGIFEEHPLLWVDEFGNARAVLSAYEKLSPEDQARVLEFTPWPHRHSTRQAQKWRGEIGRYPTAKEMRVLRTFYNNNYFNGLFSMAAKLNHSCQPNVFVSGNQETKTVGWQVIRPINEGEELLVSYLAQSEREPIAVRADFLDNFYISCSCLACDKKAPGFREQEARRTRMKFLYEQVAANRVVMGGEYSREHYEKVLGWVLEALPLFEKDGVATPALSILYEKAAICHDGLGDTEACMSFAQKVCNTDAVWAGANHPVTEVSNNSRINYRAYHLFGLRNGDGEPQTLGHGVYGQSYNEVGPPAGGAGERDEE